MLKLSKKTEYALMAVKYIALKPDCSCITAKEISENYKIPYELLAKILQKLSKNEIVASYQGVKGGYSLIKIPEEITLIDIINAIEPDYKITECMNEQKAQKECMHLNCCMIKDPLMKVQIEIDKVFRAMTIKHLL